MAMDLSSGLITCDACHEQVEGFRPVKHYLLHYSAYLDLILQRLRSTPILRGQLTRLGAELPNSWGQQQTSFEQRPVMEPGPTASEEPTEEAVKLCRSCVQTTLKTVPNQTGIQCELSV